MNKKTNELKLIKEHACRGLSASDCSLFMHIIEKTGLDPLMNQIYAVPRGGKITVQTSIDGFRILAERTGKYSPGKATEYFYDDSGNLTHALVTVLKQTTDNTWHEVSVAAYWKEYVQKTKDGRITRFWSQFSHLMLAKCAEALALRKAFPIELSGLYTKDEMAQAEVDGEVIEKELKASQLKELALLLKQLSSQEQKEIFEFAQIKNIYEVTPDKLHPVTLKIEEKIKLQKEKEPK